MMEKRCRAMTRCKIIAKGNENVLSAHLKTASGSKTMSKYHGEISRTSEGTVDLASEMSKHPEALWIRAKAIEAGIPNDNGDCFDREEILKSYKTFEGVPVFTNHENNKIELAKGKVILAEWNEEDQSVYCTMFIDRKAYPSLCRAVEEGYATDVSMGTQVEYSICSECNNRAATSEQYCNHVKTMKGRAYNGKKVYEKNYGLKFIELSVVTDGACKDCTIREIIDPPEISSPLAAAAGSEELNTVKIGTPAVLSILTEVKTALNKNAGQDELRKLNEAMTQLEEVARSMLDQRQYIDLEFLSKLTDVLADLQHVTDELVDQGYGSVGQQGQPQGAAGMADVQIPPLPQEQGGAVPNPVVSGPAGGAGKITEPIAAVSKSELSVLSSRMKDLHDQFRKYTEEARSPQGGIQPVNTTIQKLAKVWENPSVRDFQTQISEGELRVIVTKEEVCGMQMTPSGWTKVASLKVAELDQDIREGLKADVKAFASHMLDALKVKLANKLPDTAKQQEQTMEAQLRDQKGNLELHPRTDEVRESITEKQLSQKHDGYDKHKRTDDPKEIITEKQLGKESYDDGLGHERQDKNQAHEETMELQLRDKGIQGNSTPAASDRPWANVSEHNEAIHEKQLNEWRKSDEGHNPEHAITEKQLKDQDEPWGRRIASVEDAQRALAATMSACAKTCIATGATPDEVVSAIATMTSSPKNIMAAEKLAEKLAKSKDQRADMLKRASFHGKKLTASIHEVEDYLLGSLVDAGMVPEVALKSASNIPMRQNVIESISAEIVRQTEAAKTPSQKPVDFFREAIAREAEESVRIHLNVSDIKEKPENVEAFAKAAYAIATKVASASGVKITKNVQIERSGNLVFVSLAGTKMTEEEIKTAKAQVVDVAARRAARKEVVAQVPSGGGMPPAPNGGGMEGGGTTMPSSTPGDPSMTPPVSSLSGGDVGKEEADSDDGEAQAPGSSCFVCHSSEVDVKDGEWRCNNCGAEGTITVNISVKSWPNTIEEKGPGKKDEGSMAEDAGGLGDMTGGPGLEMPQVGLAATFKVTPEMVKKSNNKPIGTICPHCCSTKVKVAFKTGHGRGSCEACKGEYKVDAYVKPETHELIARVEWQDIKVQALAIKEAKLLRNEKKAKLEKALKEKSLSDTFAKADIKGKAKIVASLQSSGLL